MARPGSCHKCKQLFDNLIESVTFWSNSEGFCSSTCKILYYGDIAGYGGGTLTFIAFILMIGSGNTVMIWFFVLGLAIVVYGSYLRSTAAEGKIGSSETVYRAGTAVKETSWALIKHPDDLYIYSDILKAKVHPCCYQSARLSDKYCPCGRAIEYPWGIDQ